MAQWKVVCAERPRPSRLRGERVNWEEWCGGEVSPPFLRADSDKGLEPRGVGTVLGGRKEETAHSDATCRGA